MRTRNVLAFMLAAVTHAAYAQPGNDNCSNAIAISCGGTYAGTTVGAGMDMAPTCNTPISAPGVWYVLEGAGQQVVVNTCTEAGYDTKINVYTGGCAGLTCVTGNDDACGLASSVSFVTTAGVDYLILVQGYNNLTGTFNLEVDCAPVTLDACSGALPIACGQSVEGNTDDATTDSVSDCGTGIQAPGEWYTFSGVGGQVVLSTCPDAPYDTRLNVYTGSCGALVCVGGNDDVPNSLCSEVIFQALPGNTYFVLVQGFNGATGPYTLSVECNSCPTPSNVTFDPLDTSSLVDWDSTEPGADFIVEYGVQGFTPGSGSIVNGTIPGDGPPVTLTSLTPGTSYDVYITQDCGTAIRTAGPFTFTTLDQSAAPNSICDGAIPLACGGEVEGNTIFGLQTQAPTCGSADITTRGLWYTFIGDGQQATLSTCASAVFDSKISVFTGSCGTFTCVAGNDDAVNCAGNTSEVVFPSVAGTTYWVLVHGYGGAQGTFTLSLDCAPGCTPADNDACTAATLVSLQPTGGCEASTGTTVCAFAPAAPNPPCDPFGAINDVWYTFNTGWATEVVMQLSLVDAGSVSAALYTACEAPEYIECWTGVDGTVTITGLTQNTDLLLRVWNGGGAEAGTFTLCVEADLSTGVGSEVQEAFQLWPVPATSMLSVRPTSAFTQLRVIDAQGRLVASHGLNGTEQATISVEALAPGIYLLRTEDGRLLGRFVKE